MEAADKLFEALRDGSEDTERQRQLQQLAFEERTVKQLLRFADVQLNLGQAVKESRDDYQVDGLCFRWFHDRYPRFPVQLGASKLAFTSGTRVGWTDLFGSGFMRLPWMRAYKKLVEQMGYNLHAERVGLVFNAPHANKATTMVLHNQPIQVQNVEDPERREETETRILRPYGNPRVTYVLESFRSFMDTVGTQWAVEN